MNLKALFPIAALLWVGCAKPTDQTSTTQPVAADPHAALDNLAIDRVAQHLDSKTCTPVDANNVETRAKYGTLPGAVLLANFQEPLADLPNDKNARLVFYCGGPQCTAAPKAAEAALRAGYTHVSVMRDGIKGWVAAGKPVQKPAS